MLRVLSYNIHKGLTVGNLKYVMAEIRSTIQASQADIVFLQEVIGSPAVHKKNQIKSAVSQFEYLAHQFWPFYVYGKNVISKKRHYGNAILSKFPIIEQTNINLTVNRLEKRGLLHAIIKYPENRKLHLMGLHLNLGEKKRKEQLNLICEYILNNTLNTDSIIVAGDFNDWRERISSIFQKNLNLEEAFLTLHGQHARTFPSLVPLLPLDRIYYRGLKIIEAKILGEKAAGFLSDHLALIADFY